MYEQYEAWGLEVFSYNLLQKTVTGKKTVWRQANCSFGGSSPINATVALAMTATEMQEKAKLGLSLQRKALSGIDSRNIIALTKILTEISTKKYFLIFLKLKYCTFLLICHEASILSSHDV